MLLNDSDSIDQRACSLWLKKGKRQEPTPWSG